MVTVGVDCGSSGTVSTSDSAVKDSVPLTYGLTDLLAVDTIMYKWKTQAALPDTDPEKNYQYYGVCADQLDPLFPELIYNTQKPYMLNYSELIPVCINAIKDLHSNLITVHAELQQQLDINATSSQQMQQLQQRVDELASQFVANV